MKKKIKVKVAFIGVQGIAYQYVTIVHILVIRCNYMVLEHQVIIILNSVVTVLHIYDIRLCGTEISSLS